MNDFERHASEFCRQRSLRCRFITFSTSFYEREYFFERCWRFDERWIDWFQFQQLFSFKFRRFKHFSLDRESHSFKWDEDSSIVLNSSYIESQSICFCYIELLLFSLRNFDHSLTFEFDRLNFNLTRETETKRRHEQCFSSIRSIR